MAHDGVYRSQFQTGTSNGGLTAYRGGDRWRWESRLFNGRYDDRHPSERPVYGALNYRNRPYGGSIRFGSAYFRLRSEATSRSTFCFPDSVFEPDAVSGPEALGELIALAEASQHDLLDHYVEAHVHGGVVLDRDVEALVLDPCYKGTRIEAVASSLPCRIEWHRGLSVTTRSLDPAYRGAPYVSLARSLGKVLTPDLIGAAARAGEHDPQALKRVWHYLARFGQAADD